MALVPALVATILTIGVDAWWRTPVPVTATPNQESTKGSSLPSPAVTQPTPPLALPSASVAGKADEGPWWAILVGKAFWPVSLLIALLILAYNSRLRRYFGIARVIKKVSAGGIEMTLDADAMEEIRKQLRGSFDELVESTRVEYERSASVQSIAALVGKVLDTDLAKSVTAINKVDGLRATVHVPDVVFPEYLYQLIDYEPRGDGADRRFSVRFGIIGRSWRLGESLGTGNAFETSTPNKGHALIMDWGMTKREASGHPNGRPSSLSVILEADGVAVGVLYIDSTIENAFGESPEADAIAKTLAQCQSVLTLARSVSSALKPLQQTGANLYISKP